MTTWSQSSSACGITCVENSTVAPRRCSARIRSFSSRVLTGSRPLNGSSRIKRSGSWMIAARIWIFCDMPFESSSQRFPSTPLRPMRSIAACTRSRRPRSGDALQARDEREIRGDLHLAIEAALLGQVADAVLRLERRRVPEHAQLARVRHQDRHDHADRRRLAGAVRPDEAVQRAARDREIEPVDGRQAAERLRDAAQIDRRVSSPARSYSNANATSSAGVSRPTASTTYCLPSSMYVIGLLLAAPGSGSSATTAPVALS